VAAAREHWRPAYVGIGSNLDDPGRQVTAALGAVRGLPDCGWVIHSGLWRSAPVGRSDQPEFVNAVAGFLTTLDAYALLRHLQAIERAAGRRREERWGPRTLDLDLLVLGSVTLDDETLTLPHPRIAERNFVLLPLSEIAPHLPVPGRGTVARLLAGVSRTSPKIERLQPER
jgi:2-amino-4-hydroxy-6-hydroxymethyldihydropteridine diphosphokinase